MKTYILMITLFLTSCATSKKVDMDFKILYSGQNTTIEGSDYLLVDNNQKYIDVIKELNINEDSYNKLLDIDFTKNNICILLLGQRNTGGYSIEVQSMKKIKGILYIDKKENTPAKGEMVTMALTNPYCIVVIPKMKQIIVK